MSRQSFRKSSAVRTVGLKGLFARLSLKLYQLLASPRFVWVLLALFAAEALWIAFSGRFPMASDEDFHLDLIKLHAEQLSPFFASQPPNSDHLGAVVRDPSFLYHYLMSFPYRIIDSLYGFSEYAVVMTLRLIDISLFLLGIIFFRKAILAAKVPMAVANAALLFFVLTPIAPFVAAQINYDNLLIPISGLIIWLSVRLLQAVRQTDAAKPVLPAKLFLALVSLCMLASLVKYAYLPVFATLAAFMAVVLWRRYGSPRGVWRGLRNGWALLSARARAGLVALLVVAGGLFTTTYGYNVVKYATPAPECNQVIGVERCKAYGAWNRNYTYAQTKPRVSHNPITFSKTWGANYLRSTFFTINGIYSGFLIGVPLPVMHYTVLAAFWIGAGLIIWRRKELFSQQPLRLFGVVSVVYLATLWIQNYGEFVRLNEHVAEQGRYTLIVLPLVYALIALAARSAIRAVVDSARKRLAIKAAVVLALLALFTQGGGALTYIVRSNHEWWWQNSSVRTVNETVQNLVRPFLYGSHTARKEDMPGNYD